MVERVEVGPGDRHALGLAGTSRGEDDIGGGITLHGDERSQTVSSPGGVTPLPYPAAVDGRGHAHGADTVGGFPPGAHTALIEHHSDASLCDDGTVARVGEVRMKHDIGISRQQDGEDGGIGAQRVLGHDAYTTVMDAFQQGQDADNLFVQLCIRIGGVVNDQGRTVGILRKSIDDVGQHLRFVVAVGHKNLFHYITKYMAYYTHYPILDSSL